MGKAAAAMAFVFMAGGGIMTVLSGLAGAWTEAAALAIVGAGMLGTSHLFGLASKAKQPAERLGKPLADPAVPDAR